MAAKRVDKVILQQMWLTGPQLTQYMGFGNRSTQQEWRDSGLLPYYRINRMILYNRDEVDDFVRKHKQDLINNTTNGAV